MTAEHLRFGAYEVLFELAAGGMATVYVARKLGAAGFERLVVVKRVHRHLLRDREFFDMLRDEARIASLIVHPNVVGVDDVVEVAGELLLTQPYVESVPLSALLRAAHDAGERLPAAVVVRIVTDVLAGLHAAHEARDMRGEPLHVVHRDVSPHNVLVGADGRSRLIDFGIARAERRATHTKTGVLKGKLSYMAPEALRQVPLDRRADLFAAGAMTHEALTGKRLFDGDDEADVLLAVMITEPEPPSSIAPEVPAALDGPVLAALERRPEDRVATAAELLEALERALPPAPPREVAAIVERLCGDRLATSRARIRAALDAPAGDTAGAAPQADTESTEVAPRSHQIPEPVREATVPDARVSTVPLSPASPPAAGPAGRSRRTFTAIAAVGLLIGVGVAFALLTGEEEPPLDPSMNTTAPLPLSARTSASIAPLTTVSAEPLPVIPGASTPSPRPRPPATAPTSELHKNPYATP